MILVFRVAAHGRRRELGEAERQVDVGARVIDAPAVAVAIGRVAEEDAAEQKVAVEVLWRGHLRRWSAEAAESPAPALAARHRCEQGGKQHADPHALAAPEVHVHSLASSRRAAHDLSQSRTGR